MTPSSAWREILVANGLTARMGRREPALGRIAAALIYGGVYLKDVIGLWAPPVFPPLAAILLLGLGALCAIAVLLLREPERATRTEGAGILLVSVFAYVISSSLTLIPNTSSYYIAPLLAYLLINTAPRTFFTLIVIHLIVSLGMQMAEYLTDSYLFAVQSRDGLVIDEVLTGGELGIMRAKGLFPGPLNAVAFAAWLAFLYRGRSLFAGLMLLSAFLASGRLGIVVATILLLLRLVNSNADANSRGRFLGVAVIVALLGAFIAHADATWLAFFSYAFDQDSSQNLARIHFWLSSINHFLNYD